MVASPAHLDPGAAPAGPPSALGGASPLIVDGDRVPEPCGWWQRAVAAAFARAPLLRNVAFRIGALFWLLFNLCLAFAGWGAYETLQARLLARLDDALLERYALVGAVYEAEGIDRVIEISRSRELLPMESSVGFHLAGPDGRKIAGNVPMHDFESGWSVVPGSAFGMDGAVDGYRFLTVPLGENTLALGLSLEPLTEMREVARHCLLLVFAVTTVLALLCAAWVSRRLRRRGDGWARALERLAAGDLAERLPVSCTRDSIDDMALTVNAALERLARNVDTMREVSTNIAHDLKTPLNRLCIHLEEIGRASCRER